jgi:hypothetical protein
MKGIPAKWIKPVGEEIKLHKFTGDCDAPKTISELTDRTIALAETSLKTKQDSEFGTKTVIPSDMRTRLFRNRLAEEALLQDNHCGIEQIDGKDVRLHYGGEPVIRPGIGKIVRVSGEGLDPQSVSVQVPKGWNCTALGNGTFEILAKGGIKRMQQIKVKTKTGTAGFVLLGPDEAKGFAAGNNVQGCPKCRARIEACMC